MTSVPAFPVRRFSYDWNLPKQIQDWFDDGFLFALIMPADLNREGPCMFAPYTPSLVFSDGTWISSHQKIVDRFPDDVPFQMLIKATLYELMDTSNWRSNPAAMCWHAHTKDLQAGTRDHNELLVAVFSDGSAWVWSSEPEGGLPNGDCSDEILMHPEMAEFTLQNEQVCFDALGVLAFPESRFSDSAHGMAQMLKQVPVALQNLNTLTQKQHWHIGPRMLLSLIEKKHIRTPTVNDIRNDLPST